MSPRLVLVSGAGGAGRSTLAAATAALAAESGERVLLVAADDPHRSVDGLLGHRLGPEPLRIAFEPGLFALRLDEQAAFRAAGVRLLERAKGLFDLLGVEPLEPEELTALPGASHLALLDLLRTYGRGRERAEGAERGASFGAFDLVVVDAPPVAQLVAALALPEQLDAYLARLLPDERQAARALRPVLAGLAGVPMPSQWLFEARAWASAELADIRAVLRAPSTSIRLVTAPPAGPRARAELLRARAGLALHQLPLESLLVNRVPVDGKPTDGSPTGTDSAGLDLLRAAWDVPVHAVPDLGREPERVDLGELAEPSALVTWTDTPAREAVEWRVEDRLDTPDRVLVWHIPLPGTERGDLELVRRGDELALGVGCYRRSVPLPSALRRCTVAGAALRDGVLTVRFAPDPSLWPASLG
ncbi:ArsA family ATPase [Streptacidiphilus fuscans]|uniref:ArsA family ATPase n=1 Tax=Streptacidiphilus fuscans TaxID=2789292 RepID=A0A931FHT9_9ACTN|nr:ArsA family ATPase [Streptacidiphilus fuscans]MBF9071044.1 ArsA family ATPase [Streptacidiphilus fuscans]